MYLGGREIANFLSFTEVRLTMTASQLTATMASLGALLLPGIPFRLTVVGRRRFLASPRMEALTFSKRTFTLITAATCVRTQLAVHTV